MNQQQQQKEQRVREFAIVTYLNEKQLTEVLEAKKDQVRAYAYGIHNKDEGKQNHIHFVVKLYNAKTKNAILKWFRGFYDDKNQQVNTFVETIKTTTNEATLYIAHENIKGEPIKGKYHYGKEIIISENLNLLTKPVSEDRDTITLAVMEILEGKPLREVAIKYGRDFIIHYHSIKRLIDDIVISEAEPLYIESEEKGNEG